MEVSVMGSLQVNLGRNNDFGFFSFCKNLNARVCNLKNNHNYSKRCNFGRSLVWPSKSAFGFTLRASATSENGVSVIPQKALNISRTVPGISIGLGPEGELRYPSHHHSVISNGAGEFQCFDKFMLSNLKQHAEMHGNSLWGLGGPHDDPSYDDHNPISGGFFMENGGS